ncbi:MAG: TIGR00282 family metallophosphoesterase [Treponemataceae bacterium]
MRVLYLAEIVGKSGISAVKEFLPSLKLQYEPDYIIVNANSASGAGGLSRQNAGYLRKLGADCITLGDNAFLNTQIFSEKLLAYCLRPVNLSKKAPGLAYKIFRSANFKNTAKNEKHQQNKKQNKSISLVVVSLLGQYGRHRISANDPLDAIDNILRHFGEVPIVVDFASFSTAEKQLLAYYVDGRVSAVIGSGMKVASADEKILTNGTAYITDAGRTGAFFSTGGYAPESKIREFKTGLTEYSAVAWEGVELQGVFINLDENNKATSIERIRIK